MRYLDVALASIGAWRVECLECHTFVRHNDDDDACMAKVAHDENLHGGEDTATVIHP